MAIIAPFQIPVDTKMPLESGRYFVVGCGDAPDALCFDILSAKGSQAEYIDVFDETGKHIGALKAEWELDADGHRFEDENGQTIVGYNDA